MNGLLAAFNPGDELFQGGDADLIIIGQCGDEAVCGKTGAALAVEASDRGGRIPGGDAARGAARQLRSGCDDRVVSAGCQQFGGKPLSVGFRIVAVTDRLRRNPDPGPADSGFELRNDRGVLLPRQPAEAAAALLPQVRDDAEGGVLVIACDERKRGAAFRSGQRSQENPRPAQCGKFVPVAVGAVNAPDQEPVEKARLEQPGIVVVLLKFRAVEQQKQIVAGPAERLFDTGENLDEVCVVEGVVSHLLLRRHQQPDDIAAAFEETLGVHVRNVIQRPCRFADSLLRLFRNRQFAAAVVQDPRHGTGRKTHMAGQFADGAALFRGVGHQASPSV